MKNRIYILGDDCFSKALYQSLSIFDYDCKLCSGNQPLPDNIKPFSTIIYPPAMLPTASSLVRKYHELFGANNLEWVLIIGILQNQSDYNYLKEHDILGGKDNALIANIVPGLNILSLPLNLLQLLSMLKSTDQRIIDRYGYQKVRASGTLSDIITRLKEQRRGTMADDASTYEKIEQDLFNLDLQLLLSHKSYNDLVNKIKQTHGVNGKIEAILQALV